MNEDISLSTNYKINKSSIIQEIYLEQNSNFQNLIKDLKSAKKQQFKDILKKIEDLKDLIVFNSENNVEANYELFQLLSNTNYKLKYLKKINIVKNYLISYIPSYFAKIPSEIHVHHIIKIFPPNRASWEKLKDIYEFNPEILTIWIEQQKLSINSLGILPNEFHLIRKLKYIDLCSYYSDDKIKLEKFTNFHTLIINCSLTPFKNLSLLKSLIKLHLLNCKKINDTDVGILSTLTNLTDLKLERSCVKERGIKKISNLPKIKFLGLSENKYVGEPSIVAFSLCTQLLALNLSGCDFIPKILDPLAILTNLQAIDLSNCMNVNFAPPFLRWLKNLTFLDLSYCGLKRESHDGLAEPDSLSSIANLKNLTAISLSRTHVNDTALGIFSSFRKIKILDLTLCSEITDAGMFSLINLNALELLNICGCVKVTDRGIEALTHLKNLYWINASGCPNINEKSLKSFKHYTFFGRKIF
ncbi:MAG: hypothetical protein H0V82_12695 [Candidatus Protochlamydia sp.]|nr:hypothetical protein [Candidatus Protochlamydia sp.]